jgi:preprotein translocase subunit SecD
MAAMALVLGMAIDANVLINERVREELRNGASPQAAIHAGYDRAWATIHGLQRHDADCRPGAAGLWLRAGARLCGGALSGHLTSMFSGVFFSRGLVNLWYGRQKKLKGVSIGTVWRPDAIRHRSDQGRSRERHGIFQNPRHSVHAACAGVQCGVTG